MPTPAVAPKKVEPKSLKLSALVALGMVVEDGDGADGKKRYKIADKRAMAYMNGARLCGDDGKELEVEQVHLHDKRFEPGSMPTGKAPSPTAAPLNTSGTTLSLGTGGDADADEPADGNRSIKDTVSDAVAKAVDMAMQRIAPPQGRIQLSFNAPQNTNTVPATARRYTDSVMRVFKDIPGGMRCDELAYQMAMSVIASCRDSYPHLQSKAKRYIRDNGLPSISDTDPMMKREATEGSFQDGGFARFPEYIGPLWDAINIYGKYIEISRHIPMSSDEADASFPRLKNLVFGRGETEDISGDETNIEQIPVILNARDIRGVCGVSRDLTEDMLVPIFDMHANEMMISAARTIDYYGFSGDGSSSANGFIGMRKALRDVATTITDIQGAVAGTGPSWSTITRNDMLKLQSTMMANPYCQGGEDLTWVCSPTFYGQVVTRVQNTPMTDASNAITNVTVVANPDYKKPTLWGYPVCLTPQMPNITPGVGVTQFPILFGAWRKAAMYGERKSGQEIIVNESIFVLKNKIALIFKHRAAVSNVNLAGTTYDDGSTHPGAVGGLYITGS